MSIKLKCDPAKLKNQCDYKPATNLTHDACVAAAYSIVFDEWYETPMKDRKASTTVEWLKSRAAEILARDFGIETPTGE